MRRYAVLTLAVSGIFLMLVGVLLNSQPLFYMSTVMIVTLVLLKVQAVIATRGLRFERVMPGTIVAGELVTMRIRIWSSTKFKRPLLIITDELPATLKNEVDMRPLPVAPNFDEAVETKYEFRATRRGVFRWSRIRVSSTDSLGILAGERLYPSEPVQIIIHPTPIPFAVDLVAMSGWGASQSEQGRNRGHGIEPRGIREFLPGDSLRFVDWKSTARTGNVQVKEFETGHNTNLLLGIQLSQGSEFGEGGSTTLEAMCGHAAYLADVLLNRGSSVTLFNIEEEESEQSNSSESRLSEINDALAGVVATRPITFAEEIERLTRTVRPDRTAVLMLSIAEPGLPEVIRRLSSVMPVVALIYDPIQFSKNPLPANVTSAADPQFLSQIASQSVAIRLLSNPFTTDEKAA